MKRRLADGLLRAGAASREVGRQKAACNAERRQSHRDPLIRGRFPPVCNVRWRALVDRRPRHAGRGRTHGGPWPATAAWPTTFPPARASVGELGVQTSGCLLALPDAVKLGLPRRNGMAGKAGPPRKTTQIAKPKHAKKAAGKRETPAKPDLGAVRAEIDGIDRQIQALIARRAHWAHEVGRAKGKLAAAVDYYRPEREAQVLRRVLDRNDGPLADEVLVRLFREIMSACLAQQEPLKVGYLGPEGTFSQQAVFKHFGHSAKGFPLASIAEVFDEVAEGRADFGVVPVENSGQGTIQSTLDLFLGSPLKICGEVELHVHQYLLSRSGHAED